MVVVVVELVVVVVVVVSRQGFSTVVSVTVVVVALGVVVVEVLVVLTDINFAWLTVLRESGCRGRVKVKVVVDALLKYRERMGCVDCGADEEEVDEVVVVVGDVV